MNNSSTPMIATYICENPLLLLFVSIMITNFLCCGVNMFRKDK